MESVFNLTTILMNTFFAVFSAILGVVFSRTNSFERSNQTQIVYIKEQIKCIEVIYQNENVERPNNNYSGLNSNDLLIVLLVSFLLVGLYVKYHSLILQIFIVISTMIFIGSIVFAIVLSIRNSLDGLSRYWFIVTIIVTLFNIISIAMMYRQDLTLSNGLGDYGRIFYYIIGALFIILANLIVIAIYLYIISINVFINWQNSITYKVMKFFDNIFGNIKGMTIFIAFFVVMSLGFSSGFIYELISNRESIHIL